MIFDFNKDWLFCRQDGEPKTVTLPHDAMLEEPRQKNCHNGKDCGYFPGGKYSYEKHFAVPQEYPEQKVSILFEGVYQNAVVYLSRSQNTGMVTRNLPQTLPEKCGKGKTFCV